jgi:hypothetical protein
VYAETPEGTANDESELERFAASLEARADAIGAAASFDQAGGTLSTTFHVERPSCRRRPGRRSGLTCTPFGMPGVVLRSDSRLEVRPETRAEDDVAELDRLTTRFRGRLALEPDEE